MKSLNNILKRKIFISIIFLVILIPSISLARYYEKIENIKMEAIIAEPIFKVENEQNTIIQTINKESNIDEYIFSVKNYEIEKDTLNKRISEVDIGYVIQILSEKENFPIDLKLYEIDSSEDLLNGKTTTDIIKTQANVESEKRYKLVVFWKEKSEVLENESDIRIVVNASQIK